MVFATKEKAERFIVFNKDDIINNGGKEPKRCYYCHSCAGWHVTSNDSLEKAELFDERDEIFLRQLVSKPPIKKYKKERKEAEPFNDELGRVISFMCTCDLKNASFLLNGLIASLSSVQETESLYKQAISTLNQCREFERMIYAFNNLCTTSDENTLITQYPLNSISQNDSRNRRIWKRMVCSWLRLSEFEDSLQKCKKEIKPGNLTRLTKEISIIRNQLRAFPFSKDQKKHFRTILQELDLSVNTLLNEYPEHNDIELRINLAENALKSHNRVLFINFLSDARTRISKLPENEPTKKLFLSQLEALQEQYDKDGRI